MRRWLTGVFLAAVSVIAFASTFAAGGALTRAHGVSPEVLVLLRFALAGTVMLAFEARNAAGRRRLFQAPRRRDWLLFATLGPIGTSVMSWCVFRSCACVSTVNASMADALAPLFMFALAAWQMRRISLTQIVGALCGFAGALLVIGVVSRGGLTLAGFTVGDVYVLLAALTWAFYSVCGREVINRLGSGPYTVWTMLFGMSAFLLLLPFLDCVWPSTPRAWLLVAYLGLGSTFVPFWAWNAAQKYLPVSAMGVSAYFTPVAALILAGVFLGEVATPLQLLGTVLVCCSALVEFRPAGPRGGR